MPHVVILYTGNLDAVIDMPQLCRELADAMLAVRDEDGQQVFPTGGTRVLAYPAPHFAVADGGAAGRAAGFQADYGFVYLNLRMNRGRTAQTQQAVGKALEAVVLQHFAELLKTRRIGLSIKAREIAEEKEAVEQYGSSDSGASLGDILGAALKRRDNA